MFWATFCKQICCQELLKIAQSGHTDVVDDDWSHFLNHSCKKFLLANANCVVKIVTRTKVKFRKIVIIIIAKVVLIETVRLRPLLKLQSL